MSDLDPIVHQPTRLRLLMALSGVATADFVFLQSSLGLTQGNLSTHMTKLEEAGYVEVAKTFENRMPKTRYRLTDLGRERLDAYWQALDAIRGLRGKVDGDSEGPADETQLRDAPAPSS